jgi:hypothetical protein
MSAPEIFASLFNPYIHKTNSRALTVRLMALLYGPASNKRMSIKLVIDLSQFIAAARSNLPE